MAKRHLAVLILSGAITIIMHIREFYELAFKAPIRLATHTCLTN